MINRITLPAALARRVLVLMLALGISLAGMVLAPVPVAAAPLTLTATAIGVWTEITWTNGVPGHLYPIAGDTVIIPSAYTVTVGSAAECDNITLQAGNGTTSGVSITGTNSLTVNLSLIHI